MLFGSYAYGVSNEDSDVDLLVVTNDDFIPQNFAEKNEAYLKVSNTLTEIEMFGATAFYEKQVALLGDNFVARPTAC